MDDLEEFIVLKKPDKPTPIKSEGPEEQLDWNKVDVAEVKHLQKTIEEKYMIPFNELMEQHYYDSDKVKSILYEQLDIDKHKEEIIMGFHQKASKITAENPWESQHKQDQKFIANHIDAVRNWMI